MSLRGRVALITGAGSGIGRALALELGRRGAHVVVTDLDEPQARAVAAEVGSGAEALRLDVTSAEAFEAAVEDVFRRRGRLDLLVNNAGVGLGGEVRDMSLAQWRRMMDVNLWGVIHGVHAAYPRLIRQGGGHIVNIASGAGLVPRPGMTAYAAAKHAVVGLSTSLRAEAAGLGVRVSVVCPGHVATRILERTTFVGLDGERLRASIPLRPISAEACARAIVRGVLRNRAVIPVSALTRLEWLLYRLWPALGGVLARWRGEQMRAHRLPEGGAPCLR